MLLTDDQISDFQRDGAVVVRGIFSDWVETMAEGIAANMADPGECPVLERPGRTSPPFPGHGMVAGDRLRRDWFPVLKGDT